jgi:hypothetical protein
MERNKDTNEERFLRMYIFSFEVFLWNNKLNEKILMMNANRETSIVKRECVYYEL